MSPLSPFRNWPWMACALVVPLVCVSPKPLRAQDSTARQPPTGEVLRLAGHVVDHANRGLIGVEILLNGPSPQLLGRSQDAGSFELTNLPVEKVQLLSVNARCGHLCLAGRNRPEGRLSGR